MHTMFFLVGTALIVSACSTDFYKRTGFETLQNIQEQQCQQELSSECSDRESYEEYQRKIEGDEIRQ